MDLARKPITLVTPLPGPVGRALIERERQHLSPSLIHCYPLMVKRASGCMVEDADGNVLLDVQAGIAAASTGHCHPKVVAAMKAQADTLIHICGTDFFYPGYGELARTLSRLAPGGDDWQTFLTNSGTEGIEAALKLARHHTGRSHIIAFRGAFHGRSLGSVSLTASKPKYRRGFGPLLPGVHHVHYGIPVKGSIERDLFEFTLPPDEVAAIFVEPVLGEGGYIVPPREFLADLRSLCDKHGILLVFDEVQSGMGRTGKMFAAEHFGVVPDIFVLAKGLASGMPLGAMLAKKRVMTWGPGTHGSTTGGNPVAIAAALATIELLESELLENAERVGAHLKAELTRCLVGASVRTGVTDVRGLGMMLGVEFETHEQASRVANLCYERGLLVLECGHSTIRMSPPLILSHAQADVALGVFVQTCIDVACA